MKVVSLSERAEVAEPEESTGSSLLRPLVAGQVAGSAASQAGAGVVVGELLAAKNEARTPFVRYPGQAGTDPVMARSVVELPDLKTSQQVVLVFEDADAAKPIIIGVLRDRPYAAVGAGSSTFEVEADGERVAIAAREQLVLRCGRSSITLTGAGKILIQGEYVSSRSAGVNRIKGGSVQIN